MTNRFMSFSYLLWEPEMLLGSIPENLNLWRSCDLFTAPSQFSRKLSAADSQESQSTNRRCLSNQTIFHCVCRSRCRPAVSYLPTGHRATQSQVRSPVAIHFPEPPTIRRRSSCDTRAISLPARSAYIIPLESDEFRNQNPKARRWRCR